MASSSTQNKTQIWLWCSGASWCAPTPTLNFMSYPPPLCSLNYSHTGFLQKHWEGQVCLCFRAFAFLFPGPGTFFLPLVFWVFGYLLFLDLQINFMSSARSSWTSSGNESPSLPMPIRLPHYLALQSCCICLLLVCFYLLDHNLNESRKLFLSYSSECLDQTLVH